MPSLSQLTSGVSYQTTTYQAGETIQAGDVVGLGSDNRLYWIDDPNGAQANNWAAYKYLRANFCRTTANNNLNTMFQSNVASGAFLGLTGVNMYQYYGDSLDSKRQLGAKQIQLANGNVLFAFINTSAQIIAYVYNPGTGAQVGSTITVMTGLPGTGAGFEVIQLVSGNVLFAWLSSTTQVTCVVYDPTVQTIQVAATNIAANAGKYGAVAAASYYPQAVQLTGGNIVLITPDTTNVFYIIINTSLGVVKASTTCVSGVETRGAVPNNPTLNMLVRWGTGFAIAVGGYASNAGCPCVQLYNSAGTRIAEGGESTNIFFFILGMSDGSVMFMTFYNTISNNPPSCFIIPISVAGVFGAPVYVFNQSTSNMYQNCNRAMVLADGNWVLANGGTIWKFGGPNFTQILGVMKYDALAPGSYQQLSLTQDPNTSDLIIGGQKTGAAGSNIWLVRFNPTTYQLVSGPINTFIANPVNYISVGIYGLATPIFGTLSSFAIVMVYNNNSGIFIANYVIAPPLSMVGVAQNGNTAGGTVAVQTQGVANTRLTFVNPINSNLNSALITGNRVSIVRNRATLMGMQPSQSRNIN